MENNERSKNDSTEIERKISKQACDVLNELRRGGQLCDAVITVENDSHFPVHRAILSACSPYFRALFTNGLNDTEKREVFIPGITSDMMAIIIDYAYTREVNVTADNVEMLLPAADQFHVLGLVKACVNFLKSQIDCSNCLGIRNFAKDFFCLELENEVHKFIMENFVEISTKSNELLNLPLQELVDILKRDELNVKDEEVVFECVIRWISHDPKNRRKHILPLLKTVRLGSLRKEYFMETAKNHPYVKESDECRPIIIEIVKYLYKLEEENGDVDLAYPLARPRIPHEVMFAVGGWSGGSATNAIETYDTRADKWILVDGIDIGPRAYHGVGALNKMIYIIGGFDGTEYFNSCRCFDPEKKIWQEIAPMNCKRCYVSVAVLGNCLYAMGGFNGNVRQNSAERYTPKNNQWSFIKPMNHQRSDASATTFKDKIYICGGFNGAECLRSAEYYDPAFDEWTLIASMKKLRSGIGIIALGQYIYAIGGFDGGSRLSSAERYNPETNTWSDIDEMYQARSNLAIEVIDDMVFAIGGFNGTTTIYAVECYDPVSEEWYDCTDMNVYRSALSACVIKGLANVKDYIHPDRFLMDKRFKSVDDGINNFLSMLNEMEK